MRNAQTILDEVKRKCRNVNAIICAVADRFGCSVDDVQEGVETVVGELVTQKFLEVEAPGGIALGHLSTGETPVISVNGQDARSDNRSSARLEFAPQDGDWTPLGGFYLRHGLPLDLHIDLTDACNEKCVHCYLPHGGRRYIETGIAFRALKEFREAQGMTVYISGGECMLHRDFAEILCYAKSLDLNIIVLSNLTLCDEKKIELMREIDPQFINVSLYAVTEDIHDSVTQISGSCRKTKAAIDALQTAGVHIRIATPFMRRNKDCVQELKEYAGARYVHLVADSEIFGQLDHSCANQSHALSMQELEQLLSSHKDVFLRGRSEPERCLCDAKVCDIGEGRLNLDAEGKYYPCDGFHGAIIGDAQKDSLWDVWTGEALNRLRALKNKDFGSCATCVDRAWCKVCPMRNFNETGDMFTHATWRCEMTRIYRRIFEERKSC